MVVYAPEKKNNPLYSKAGIIWIIVITLLISVTTTAYFVNSYFRYKQNKIALAQKLDKQKEKITPTPSPILNDLAVVASAECNDSSNNTIKALDGVAVYFGLSNTHENQVVLAKDINNIKCPKLIYVEGKDNTLSQIYSSKFDEQSKIVYLSLVYGDLNLPKNINNKLINRIIQIEIDSGKSSIVWEQELNLSKDYNVPANVHRVISDKYILLTLSKNIHEDTDNSQDIILNIINRKSINLGNVDINNILFDLDNKLTYYKRIESYKCESKNQCYKTIGKVITKPLP